MGTTSYTFDDWLISYRSIRPHLKDEIYTLEDLFAAWVAGATWASSMLYNTGAPLTPDQLRAIGLDVPAPTAADHADYVSGRDAIRRTQDLMAEYHQDEMQEAALEVEQHNDRD